MKKNILKGRAFGNRIIFAISLVAIILLLVLNLLVTYIGLDKLLIIDTTYEGLYTLTDLMKEECAYINELDTPIEITFCADPDTLIASDITRVPYFMALQIEKEFDNVKVNDENNVVYNPTAFSKYKSTSLKEIGYSDIIVSYGDRYRITNADRFWITSYGEYAAFCGEYRLATLFKSVTSIDQPVAYFVTNHGETYYDKDTNPDTSAAHLYDMLVERGLTTKTIDLSKEDIPEDCALLIINNPRVDFISDRESFTDYNYISETEKLDKYLVTKQGAVMIAKDYALSLPTFDEFLYEWGFDTSNSLVKDTGSCIVDEYNSATGIIAQYDKDENSYGYAIYGDFASLSSAPSMLFTNSGYISCSYGEAYGTNEPGSYSISRNYAPFFFTTEEAVAYEKNEAGEYVSPSVKGKLDLAAVTTRMQLDNFTGEYTYSYVFCANSPDFFSSNHLGNPSFANYEVMSALVENVIRTDEYASIELGSESANAINRGGKLLLDTNLYDYNTGDLSLTGNKGITKAHITWFTVIIMAIPVAVAVFGIVIRIKRKNL